MNWFEKVRTHGTHAKTRAVEGARAAVATGKDLAGQPAVHDFAADVALETMRRFAEAPRPPAEETRRARWRRRAGVVFSALDHVTGIHLDRAHTNSGTNGTRR